MLDLPTLLLALVATDLVLGATLAIGSRGRFRDGVPYWFGALGARVASIVFLGLPASAGDPALAIVAVTLLALSYTLQAAALLQFGSRRLPAWVHTAVLAGVGVPFALLAGDTGSRILFTGLALGTVMLVIAGIATQLQAPISRATRALAVGAYVAGAVVFYVRAVGSAWAADPLKAFLEPSALQAITLMLAYMATLAASCAFMLLLKERGDASSERLASLDSLTGAYNRRSFLENAERTLALALRANQPLSVIMVDIDHFRRINEHHGQRIGDEVLRRLADVVRSQLRKEDLLSRFGGEEFCVLLPQVPGPGAVIVAGRIRKAVCAEPIRIDGREIEVTVSAGVAARLDEGPESIDAILGRADQAMSLAKNRGRNRVVALSLGRSVAA
ncbi:hypothetical protein BWI17_02800 [Betaproteobacteria bacterium GR16-43]|nr:hypothetical protein BWI17_02800 [Betaproteobacteria bacterium GR16-43]